MTGNWKYPLPLSLELKFSSLTGIRATRASQKQMIFLFSFSCFNFCRTLTFSQCNSKRSLLSVAGSTANFCLPSSESKVEFYTANCTGQRAKQLRFLENNNLSAAVILCHEVSGVLHKMQRTLSQCSISIWAVS